MRDDDPPLSVSPIKTVNGCTCKGTCTTSITDGFKCDTCKTQWSSATEACGTWSLDGHWDYCEYPEMTDYEAQNASKKMDQLWGRLTAPGVVGHSGKVKSLFGVLGTMIGESMRTPFDDHWDVLPEGRSKVIHSQGVHCKFELEISAQSPYTGILAPGKKEGIIRMGSATSVDVTGKAPFPGLAFKFLRSGVHSGNFVALRATGADGQSYAFFDEAFSKIVAPPPALKALMKFSQASKCQSMVGLSDLCSYGQDGSPSDSLEFPYDIRFGASSSAVYLPNERMTDEELLGHLSDIAPGTHLLDVFTKTSPTAEHVLIGTLSTASACVKSTFGDESLFFRHQRMEEDFTKHPEWISDVHADGCDPVATNSDEWKCPGVH